jgi:hypothetical protein
MRVSDLMMPLLRAVYVRGVAGVADGDVRVVGEAVG